MVKKLRVAMCIGALEGGGMGTVVDSLAGEFKKYGVEIEILTKKVLVAPPKGIAIHIVSDRSKKTLDLMDSFDIVHVNGGSTLTLLATQTKRPKLFTFHGQTPPKLHGGMNKQLKAHAIELLYKATMKKFDIIVSTSRFGQEDITKRYGVMESIWIPNGVDRGMFHQVQNAHVRKLKAQFEHPVFLGVGSLYPVKGWEEMLTYFEKYIEMEKKGTLLIAGDGPLESKLLSKINGSILKGHVKLLGKVRLSDLNDYYNACDAYVSASPYEGFCLPAVEALSCGKPLIVRHRGAMIEHALESGCGVTFEGADSFVIAAKKVLKLDPKTLKQKADNYLEPFSWKKVAKQYVDIYRQMMK